LHYFLILFSFTNPLYYWGVTMKEDQIRYLEMIQSVISRMASNSFLLKGWTVTLIVGVFALAAIEDFNSKFLLVSLIPTFFFWCLDGYFLRQELLYRELFSHVTYCGAGRVTFSMNVKPHNKKVKKIYILMLTRTLPFFYIPLMILSALGVFLLQTISENLPQ